MSNKIRGFEEVNPTMQKFSHKKTTLPARGTSKAMAYDIYAKDSYTAAPGQIIKIWTDVKAYMQDNEALLLNIRSSMGGVWMLANTQGWIDADYYSNESNDGNIGVFLKNISSETQQIAEGDRIAQAMFIPFLIADNGNSNAQRTGGFGSTNI